MRCIQTHLPFPATAGICPALHFQCTFTSQLSTYTVMNGFVFVLTRRPIRESSLTNLKNGFSFKSWQHFQKWQNCVMHYTPSVVSLYLSAWLMRQQFYCLVHTLNPPTSSLCPTAKLHGQKPHHPLAELQGPLSGSTYLWFGAFFNHTLSAF